VSDRRFRFGVILGQASSLAEWRDLTRKVEDLGYSTLFVADHLGPQLAPLPALVAAAGATTSLRLGTCVLDNDFRQPAMLAKELATVDLLTDGRLEVGLGAGWSAADYAQSGIPFRPRGERVERLGETLRILKAFFGGGPVTFEGRYFRVQGLDGRPRVVQRPHPPILIGAHGPRMLALAGREADIINFPDRPPTGESGPGNVGLGMTIHDQLAVVRRAAGDQYARKELSVLSRSIVTTDVDAALARLAERQRTTPQVMREMPSTLVGPIEAQVERVLANRERFDISYPIVFGESVDTFAPVVRRLAGA
jgi:probable F420-dependent oxidoreductase